MIGTLVLLWRRNAIGYVGIWVLAILSPTLIVPIVTEVAAERRMYLPLAVIAALAVAGGFLLARGATQSLARNKGFSLSDGWQQALAFVPAAMLAIVFGLVSVCRAAAFQDEMTLWKDAVATQPNDPTALYNMCVLLAKEGRTAEAIEDYRKALAIKPDYAEARFNLGNALLKLGKTQAALDEYQRAVELQPDLVEAQSNLGILLLTLHRPEEATAHFEEAVRVDPNDAEVLANLVVAYSQTNRMAEAIAAAKRASRRPAQKDKPTLRSAWRDGFRVTSIQPRPMGKNNRSLAARAMHRCCHLSEITTSRAELGHREAQETAEGKEPGGGLGHRGG